LIVAILGVGTGVGKTVATAGWLRHLRAHEKRMVGWKAIESGGDDDERALADASGERIPALHRFAEPVSPHLGARRHNTRIDAEAVRRRGDELARGRDGLLIELAGGAFSPLDDEGLTNADVVAGWCERAVLVASDRLGVLHDVEACRRAGLRFDALFLTRGPIPDASRASNAKELARRLDVPIVAADFARSPIEGLAALDGWFP
jgi:dethiobiotin synthetase